MTEEVNFLYRFNDTHVSKIALYLIFKNIREGTKSLIYKEAKFNQ